MDKYMLARVREDTPKTNPDITNGLAVKLMPYAEQYINDVFRSVSKDFPPGLEYVGGERCTPHEEFMQDPKKKGDRPEFDIAKSDIYLMKYTFRFNGTTIDRYIYLPYVSDAGSIMLSGSRYFISPVLSDVILSYERESMFVVLLRDKFSLKRMRHDIRIDDDIVGVQVVWSKIYHMKKDQSKQRKTVKANCALMHYLLCRYGFHETFERFAQTKPIVGGPEINEQTYPNSDWVICSTASVVRPKGFSAKGFYQATTLRVAIRRDAFTPMVRSMLGAFFYVVDRFPGRVMPDYVDDKRLWRVLMGLILFGETHGEGDLHDDITEHIRSLDEYMDTMMVSKFKEIKLNCPDIYSFFAVAIERFDGWMHMVPDRINSLYDKELAVLYYMFLPFTSQIFLMHFKLKTAAKKNLSENEVKNIMNMFLKPRTIFFLTKQPPGVSNMSYCGDNKFFKCTSVMVPQKKNSSTGDGDDSQAFSDNSKHLHVSFAEVGNYSNLPKSSPVGDGRVNPHLQLDSRGRVMRNLRLKPLLDSVQEKLKSQTVL